MNVCNNSDYFDSIFVDEDVQRFDADSYKEKYGDRWKKLAKTIRDVVQFDGTIVREYVIDDPSMLDQLSDSEGDNGISSNSTLQMQKINNFINKAETHSNYHQNFLNSEILKIEFDKSVNKKNDNQTLLNNENNNFFKPILPSNSNNCFGEKFTKNLLQKDKTEFLNEEEVDIEVEKIHEQGNQKLLVKNYLKFKHRTLESLKKIMIRLKIVICTPFSALALSKCSLWYHVCN